MAKVILNTKMWSGKYRSIMIPGMAAMIVENAVVWKYSIPDKKHIFWRKVKLDFQNSGLKHSVVEPRAQRYCWLKNDFSSYGHTPFARFRGRYRSFQPSFTTENPV
ncbi:hypothetical protein PBCV1_a474R [Paramecium bursaria Chlorella virus 1]|uniref:Uncharacterized protein n=1 Tax=Paramecium bursaria Chlorella virus 1 TaxID=10506 RepID=Q98524_PBCV1|nr:hypothetical protein PBCV1_a474R [Paramecium bursaria Chlorella virus 1]AAC96841.1 hypothetical protein [Paramecium bursaria Chlorella virus 1]